MHLPPHVTEAMLDEARACWPREACGVIVGGPSREGWRFVRFDNLQDRLHAADPVAWPRDARTAYSLDPLKLQRLVDQAESQGEALLAIVHSHPEHRAYFSRTDAAAAAPFGQPTFPGAAQVVVSVVGGEVREVKAFRWDGSGWPEAELEGLPPLPGPVAGLRPLGDV